MLPLRRFLSWRSLFVLGTTAYATACLLTSCLQRKLLYLPSHHDPDTLAQTHGLTKWVENGEHIGYKRITTATAPRIWLMFHGNAGQAAQRDYVIPLIPADEAFFVMEYPGYGQRPGKPSITSMTSAAQTAYTALRTRFPTTPLYVLGESIGSGPACHISGMSPPPDRIILTVPFARMTDLVQEKLPLLPARWLLLDRWDNLTALTHYKGTVEIYGAKHDQIIPIHHARKLANSLTNSVFYELNCHHNNWATPRLIHWKSHVSATTLPPSPSARQSIPQTQPASASHPQ